MPRLLSRPALGCAARCYFAVMFAGALACMNDAPLATADATAGLRFSANVVSVAGRTIKIAVMYRRSSGETVRVLATPAQIPLEPGATVNQDVTVDLAGCLKDGDRLPANTPGCQLMVELTLLDEAGNEVDRQTKQAPGAPTAPGQVVEFGSVTIGIQVGSVAVEPTSVQLNVTQTQELEAVVKDAAGASLTSTTVTWTPGDPSIIRLSSATGARVTVTGVKLGSTTLTASSGGKSSPPVPVTVAPLDPLSVSPASASVEAGATLQLTVANPPGVISWESSDGAIASVDQNGLVRGVQPRDSDPVTITATTGSGDTQRRGTARITVTSAPPLVITQQPAVGCVIMGQTITLAVASPPGAVSWESEHPSIATVDATSGVVRGVSAGQATIRARSENRRGTAPVCVVGPLGNVPQTLDLTAGQTAQLSPSGTSNANVGYSSDNTAVATVSGSGLITGVGVGQARITTKLTAASGSEEAQTVVMVNAAAITIEPNPVSVAVGARQALTATARDANGNPIDGVTFTWTVDDQTTAKLLQTSGNPVEVEGVKLDATSVRVTGGGASGAVQVTVTRGAAASITVTLNDSSLTVGQEGVTATAEVKDAAGNVLDDQTVTWTTSDQKVATASSTGARTATVTAVAPGNADVIASIGTISGKVAIQVSEKPVASVTLTPTSASISAGGAGQVLTAVPKDAEGNVLVGRTVTWNTGDASIVKLSAQSSVSTATGATVTVTGAKAGGPVTVTATSGDKSSTTEITVTAGAPASITLTPATASLVVGDSVTVTAVVKDAQGNTIASPDWSGAAWLSTNPNVASPVQAVPGPDLQSYVKAFGQGTANITLRLTLEGGAIVTSSALVVTVSPRIPAKIEKVGGDNAVCPVNTDECSFTVRVLDAHNQPVSDIEVDWTCSIPIGGDDAEMASTTTDAQGLTTIENCVYSEPGTYEQVATVGETTLSTTFTYTQSGLVVKYKGAEVNVPEHGKSTFSYDVTAIGVVASGLSAQVKPQPNTPNMTVTSATFTPTTTPAELKVVLCTCGLPTGISGVMDVTVSSTTPGVAPLTIELHWTLSAPSGQIAVGKIGASGSQDSALSNPVADGPRAAAIRLNANTATVRSRAEPNH